MANNKFDIISIGDCSVDHFVVPSVYSVGKSGRKKTLNLEYSAKIPAQEFKLFAGGNALNTAVSFGRLGLKTAIVTTIGDDAEAQMISDVVNSQKISSKFVRKDKNATTDKSVILVTGGERTVISYHCSKKYVMPDSFSTRWIYLTSLGDRYKPVYDRVRILRQKERFKVAYNPGSRQLMYAMADVRKILRSVDVLFLNLNEARMVAKTKTSDVKKILKLLYQMGPAQVVVTDGKKGAYGHDESGTYHVAIYQIERMDATGAGDAFASSTTAALLLGKSLTEAMRWGAVNSAFEVSKIGVQNGLLSKKVLMRIMSSKKAPKCRRI